MLIPFTSASFTNLSGLAVADGAEVEVRLESNGALAALFDDRDGTTPLTNPFNADSQGRFAFYVAGVLDGYSVEVTKGAQTHTLRHQLTGSASAISFEHAGIGSPVTRTMQDKGSERLSNADYSTLQLTLDSFSAAGTVNLNAGTITPAATLTISSRTGVHMEGKGKHATVLQGVSAMSGVPVIKFTNGAYHTVKGMTIKALGGGVQIGAAIECRVSSPITQTPQGMLFEDLFIDGDQTDGFAAGIRFAADIGQDNNNERAFIKNCDVRKSAIGISIENYNSLLHQITGGVIGDCGIGISTAEGLGGSYSANGVAFIGNTTGDIDIGDNSTHSIDLVNCKSEATIGFWIRSLLTTPRTDINITNSTWHGTNNSGSAIDYRGTGKVVIQGSQIQITGLGRKISMTNTASTLIMIGNFMDLSEIEWAGTLILIGNKYAESSKPILTALDANAKLIDLDIATPRFLAYHNTDEINVTGAGTHYTVPFNTTVIDYGGDFASNTFTAPVTGQYQLNAAIGAADISTAMSYIRAQIVTSNATYEQAVQIDTVVSGGRHFMSVAVAADMDAGDTAVVKLIIENGAGDTADVNGAAGRFTHFSGFLIR